MKFGKLPIIRVVKRLSAAVGYLELGMTQQALACLDDLDDLGPFKAVAEMLRGEAARRERRFDDAARCFETAARMSPGPDSKAVWMVLSNFHRQAGNTDLAIEALAHARGARPPTTRPKVD